MMHLHGFGLSGRYLLPTAERLADEFHTLVPDLPGFGRSGSRATRLDVPDLAHAAAAFLDDRGIERATLVGNSMGCPVICEFAHLYPERIERAILVSPAGGLFNQPLPGAMRPARPRRHARADRHAQGRGPRLPAVRRPEHGAGCSGRSPSTRRSNACSRCRSRRSSSLGDRDPLMPAPPRIKRGRRADRQPRARSS